MFMPKITIPVLLGTGSNRKTIQKEWRIVMKILKSIFNFIPLFTFIIFVVSDGIVSITSALFFIISTIGLLLNEKRKRKSESREIKGGFHND